MGREALLVGITGASGSIYAERLIDFCLNQGLYERLYLVLTSTAESVVRHELVRADLAESFSLIRYLKGDRTDRENDIIRRFATDDFHAPIASGSSKKADMVVVPCSMGTLARIATGVSTTLIERAADVALKERRRLVVCPRETPLNTIHLRHMLTLSQMGAVMVPPQPAFYNKPKSIDEQVDFVVGKLLDALGVEHSLYPKWNSRLS